MFIRKLRENERFYAWRNSHQINNRIGYIGYLRCDFGKDGAELWTTMFPYMQAYPSNFEESLQYVVDALRGIEKGFDKENQFLRNRRAMENFCYNHKDFLLPENIEKYGARIDYDAFTFIVNFYPQVGDYNAYVYCYITENLEKHLKNTEKGIQFTDDKHNILFTINDGDSITITNPNGKSYNEICRFIDKYHFETVSGVFFHIYEFYKFMMRSHSVFKPDVTKCT